MKTLFWVGLIFVVLGIVSFVVPVPRTETHSIKTGDVNIGIQTKHDEKVSPWVSAIVIVGGISMMLVGSRK